jgi:small subunit ribosomal protein S2
VPAPQHAASIKELLIAGVHFGHQTRRWNPKMKQYIFGERGGIYIIDLQKTSALLDESYAFLKRTAERGGHVLFVGTKKQCQETIKEQADRIGMPYVSNRWLGGLLTNYNTLSKRIKRMHELRQRDEDGSLDLLPSREAIKLRGDLRKLEQNLGGVQGMDRLPAAVFVVDPRKEQIVVKEARKLKIPIVALVDTNCDPDEVDYVIPGNDDAIRSCGLIVRVIADAVAEGKQLLTEAEMKAEAERKVAEAKRKAEEEAAEAKRKAEEEAAAAVAAEARAKADAEAAKVAAEAPKAPAEKPAAPAAKVEAKPEAKAEAKPAPKVEAKPEPKVEVKHEPKAEAKGIEPEAKPVKKPAAKKLEKAEEPKAEAKPQKSEKAPEAEAKPAKKPAAKKTEEAEAPKAEQPVERKAAKAAEPEAKPAKKPATKKPEKAEEPKADAKAKKAAEPKAE